MTKFREVTQGKSIAFVGSSMMRQQVQALVWSMGHEQIEWEKLTSPIANCTSAERTCFTDTHYQTAPKKKHQPQTIPSIKPHNIYNTHIIHKKTTYNNKYTRTKSLAAIACLISLVGDRRGGGLGRPFLLPKPLLDSPSSCFVAASATAEEVMVMVFGCEEVTVVVGVVEIICGVPTF